MNSVRENDVRQNRDLKKWTKKELVGRILWWFASHFFRFSPRLFWYFRTTLLRLFGAKIGSNVHIYPSVRIEIPWNVSIGDYSALGSDVSIYSLGRIIIGSRVTISQGAYICAGSHDYRDASMPLIKPTITIGDDVWICAKSFVGPGVSIGPGAILGACSVTFNQVESNAIVVGNPAKLIKYRV